jgi:hypothetical protein
MKPGLQYRPAKELREPIGAWGEVISVGPEKGRTYITDCRVNTSQKIGLFKNLNYE